MVIIKKVGVLSVAKMYSLMMAIFGFIIGLILPIVGSVAGGISGGINVGFFGLVIFPAVYGFLGFISGAIGAAVYNLVANWIGGVEIEFEDGKVLASNSIENHPPVHNEVDNDGMMSG